MTDNLPGTPYLVIKEASIKEVVSLSNHIPEFIDPHQEEVYEKRLTGKPHLILVAYDKDTAIGFKVGYEKTPDGSFYSWMGAVLPAYRQYGVAKALANHQEKWAREKGYKKIRFKTRNKLKSMQIFALKNNFHIVAVEPRDNVEDYRIMLEKNI